MSRIRYVALASTLAFLGACGGDGETTDPTSEPTSGEPIASNDANKLWEIDDVQFLGWDSENQRVVTKQNGPIDFSGSSMVDVRLQSIGLDGDIGWEREDSLQAVLVMVDFEPWPALPSQATSPRVGSYLLTSGGNTGPSRVPTGNKYIDFPAGLLDMRTGEFLKHRQVGIIGDGYVVPYGDFALQWEPIPDEQGNTLRVYDENFDVLGEQETEISNIFPNVMGDHVFLGGNFTYEAIEPDQEIEPVEDFTVSFLDMTDYSVSDVTLPGDLAPQPLHGPSWGDFENELKVVPLHDGILWNIGGAEWTIIDTEGVVDQIEMPEHTKIIATELGGELATIEEFTAAHTNFSPSVGNGTFGYLTNGANPMTVIANADEISWSSTNGPIGQVQAYTHDISLDASGLTIGPDNAWILHSSGLVRADGEEISDSWDVRFLEYVDGMSVFSTTRNGFDKSTGEMGSVFAIPHS